MNKIKLQFNIAADNIIENVKYFHVVRQQVCALEVQPIN